MLAAGLTIVLALAPPFTLPSADGARTALLVPVTDALSLTIVEASYREQEALVDAALTSDDPYVAGSKVDDPYGVVLWPAAQVVAAAVAALDPALLKGATCLELGAGTGLCSLAALACGAKRALATDYREEPLALLHLSADANEANGLASAQLETALFDIMDEAQQLGQSAPLAGPQLGFCASSGCAWRLWAARYSQGEAQPLGATPLGAPPPPRALERAACKAADFSAFGPPGMTHCPSLDMLTPSHLIPTPTRHDA